MLSMPLGFEGPSVCGHLEREPDLTMLPAKEREVVAKALDKNPEQRWDSCREFVARLREAQFPQNRGHLSHPGDGVWTIPAPRDFFTGRENDLAKIRQGFTDPVGGAPQRIQALSGLGGNGKTQLALKYAEQFRTDYAAGFWVRANSTDELLAGFAEIAKQLGLPEARESTIG
jgi:hypothetical protein